MAKLFFRIGIICLFLALPFALAASDDTVDVPGKPTNLKCTGMNAETNTLSLTWDPVPGAKGYYVYQSPQNRDWRKWPTTTPNVITTPGADVRRVTLNTKYSYRVTAYNDSGEGPPSDFVDVNIVRVRQAQQ